MLFKCFGITESRKSFAFETTCATHVHVKTLLKCKETGYRLHLIYLWLPSADIAVQRVASRVKEGGHKCSEETIRRRYISGLKMMLTTYLPLVEKAFIMSTIEDCEIAHGEYHAIAEKTSDVLTVLDHIIWQKMNQMAGEI